MKKNILALFLFLVSITLNAQTFNGTGGSIPDFNGISPDPAYFSCVVSGLPSTIDSATFGLERICLNITHHYDQDLEIKLMSPDSFVVLLSYRNGGVGQINYTSTCFRGHSANGLITNGQNPFTGEFDPEGDLFLFNNGRNPNGTWRLVVTDLSAGDSGSVTTFDLTFGNSPSPHTSAPCSTTDVTSCRCPDGTQDCDLLPDMIASAAALLNGTYEFADTLFVDNSTPNIGWGPLEIHGIDSCFCDTVPVPCSTTLCPLTNLPPKQLVMQTIYHKSNGTVTQWQRHAGTMSYHPTHFHTHLDQWAVYTVRRPVFGLDPPDWPIIGESSKQSYCLINIGFCAINGNGYCADSAGNPLGRQNIANYGMGAVSGCGIDQGIYVGNYDVYDEHTPGNWIHLDSLCNGAYYLVSITDPNNWILESNDHNNWASVPLTLVHQLSLPFPSVNFSYTGNANTITFTNGSSDFDSVSWNFGDAITDTAINPVHTYANTGIYTIVLTAFNRCGMQQRVDTIDITMLGMVEREQDVYSLNVFPNPSSDRIKIDFSMSKRSPVKLELFDAYGKSIRVLTDESLNMGSHQYVIDATQMNLASGVYSIHLTSSVTNLAKRIVFLK